jgi:hypothetical protein
MVFPETREIILEAKKKYDAFQNFYEYLDKKVTAFQIKKAKTFQEKHELENEHRTEIMKGIHERKRFLLLEKRNIGVDPESSRLVEMDFQEMQELKKVLKPSDNRIAEIKQRLETLKFSETKEALNHDVDIAQSMYEDVVWLLQKASLYEEAHMWQDKIIAKRLAEAKKRGNKLQNDGYLKNEDRDAWRKLAEAEYQKRRNKYFENLEKILAKQKLDREKAEWKRQKRLYKELIRKEQK